MHRIPRPWPRIGRYSAGSSPSGTASTGRRGFRNLRRPLCRGRCEVRVTRPSHSPKGASCTHSLDLGEVSTYGARDQSSARHLRTDGEGLQGSLSRGAQVDSGVHTLFLMWTRQRWRKSALRDTLRVCSPRSTKPAFFARAAPEVGEYRFGHRQPVLLEPLSATDRALIEKGSVHQ